MRLLNLYRSRSAVFWLIVSAVFVHLPTFAAAQKPVPLPTDPDLAAYVSVSGKFQSVILGQTRNLTMSAWAAAFAPREAFDFSALDRRAFLSLGLPEDPGSGLFEAVDPNLTINVTVTDSLHRLGSVRVYEVASGRLVKAVAAAPGGGQVQSAFQNDAAVRDYRMAILDTNGAVLSTLAVDAGKWDTVDPFTITGGFEPYYPALNSAPLHYTLVPNDVFGTQGDPMQAPGVLSTIYPGFSKGVVALDYKNDNSVTCPVSPPASFARYVKRGVIANTVRLDRFKVGDPAALAMLQNAFNQASVQDPTMALSNIDILPYDDATAVWHIVFHGQATAFLAVPFEKMRKANGFNILVAAIATTLRPKAGFLSILAVEAANQWLADANNQRSSGFKQGDVMAWGDIYALLAAEGNRSTVRNDPILQTVTFVLQPDIPPPSGIGTASLTGQGAWTTPAPPGPQNGGDLYFSSGSNPAWTTTMQLPKGFNWSVSGNVTSPMGYQAGPAKQFLTPVSGPINIPCTLTVLLQLKIYTVGPNGPMGIHVQVKNAGGTIVCEGDSALQEDGVKYAYSAMSLQPGSYTITANRSTSGGTWSGTTTVNVQRGILQETTLNVTFTPAMPPGH
jgi:hypothetical protein